MSSRRPSKSKKRTTAKQRKVQRIVIKLISVVCVLFTIVFSYSYVAHLPQFRTQISTVSGTVYTDPRLISQSIDSHFATYRWITPQNSIVRLQKRNIRKMLLDKFTIIQSVRIERDGIGELSIVITEKEPVYLLHHANNTYDVDATGEVLQQSKDSRHSSKRRWYLPEETDIQIGKPMVDDQTFARTNETIDVLAQSGFSIQSVALHNELETVLHLRDGEQIIIDREHNTQSILGTLQEIAPYKEFQHETQSGLFRSPVVYINLRYGNKIFYCYQGDECQDNYQITQI